MGMYATEYSTDKKGALALNNKATGTLFGLTAPLGKGALRASIVSRKVTQDGQTAENKLNQASIGYVYNLSPRTYLYVDASNKKATTTANFYSLGIHHNF